MTDKVFVDTNILVYSREVQARYRVSWWDSLIVASAFYVECATIVSEDLSAGQEYFGIRVVNPFA